jgi:hypothetical protein
LRLFDKEEGREVLSLVKMLKTEVYFFLVLKTQVENTRGISKRPAGRVENLLTRQKKVCKKNYKITPQPCM